MPVSVSVSVQIVISSSVFAVVPLPFPLFPSIATVLPVSVSVAISVALAGPFAMVMVMAVFPVAPCFLFFSRPLAFGLLGGQGLLKIVETGHAWAVGSSQELACTWSDCDAKTQLSMKLVE